ncbi:MAG: serine/threonine protein kinase [Thiotrichales bacterium]
MTDETALTHPYANLTPDCILDAVERAGYHPTGSLHALNSYENRVYQIGEEGAGFLVGKFYRPERWSDDQILEEHAFALELEALEIPVVAPLKSDTGATLLHHAGFRFALFPRRGGRSPELDDPDTQYRLGQFLGRIHAMGAVRPFQHRPALTVASFGTESVRYLLAADCIPREYRPEYQSLTADLLREVDARFAAAPHSDIRLHGDFHLGNVLWTDTGAHLVDLDDCRMGPAVQDVWLLLSGDREQVALQLGEILAGYEEFHDFDRRALTLIEPLRTLRLLHYAAWLARRWTDPAFPLAFPWFNTVRYWEDHIVTLREQRQRLSEPPLLLG